MKIELRDWKFEELFRDGILNKWISELSEWNDENNKDWINKCEK